MVDSKSVSQSAEDRPHPTLFKLPEYTRATGNFLGRALNAIAGAQHPLLGDIKTETHEFVPRLDTTISATRVISREPTDELVEMTLSVSHGAEGDFDELYITLSDAADKLGSAYMKRLFDYISDITDATGNVLNGDGTPRWDVGDNAFLANARQLNTN